MFVIVELPHLRAWSEPNIVNTPGGRGFVAAVPPLPQPALRQRRQPRYEAWISHRRLTNQNSVGPR
ncbi:MAG TPA: hypothetical protein VFY57_01105, partial [Rubrobacteraceae bacterium]|nr:hypothetical protein [Rubrobacteraceae bacterium]